MSVSRIHLWEKIRICVASYGVANYGAACRGVLLYLIDTFSEIVENYRKSFPRLALLHLLEKNRGWIAKRIHRIIADTIPAAILRRRANRRAALRSTWRGFRGAIDRSIFLYQNRLL